MIRHQFEVLKFAGYKSGKCGCGKYRQRQKTFVMTVNPFNRNPDGSVKTRAQVMKDLNDVIMKWRGEPITCDTCEVEVEK